MKLSSKKRSQVVGFKEHCSKKSFSSLPISEIIFPGSDQNSSQIFAFDTQEQNSGRNFAPKISQFFVKNRKK